MGKIRASLIFVGAFLIVSAVGSGQIGSLTLSSGTANSTGAVSLNFSFSSDPSNRPAALQWTFSYPAAAITAINVTSGPALTAVGKSLTCAIRAAGSLSCIAAGLNTTAIPDGVVAVAALTAGSTVNIGVVNTLGASAAGS